MYYQKWDFIEYEKKPAVVLKNGFNRHPPHDEKNEGAVCPPYGLIRFGVGEGSVLMSESLFSI